MQRRFPLAPVALILVTGLTPRAVAINKDKKAPVVSGNPTSETIFKFLDKDNDGKLSADEFKDGKTGSEGREAGKKFKTWDADDNDALSPAEYKNYMSEQAKVAKKDAAIAPLLISTKLGP